MSIAIESPTQEKDIDYDFVEYELVKIRSLSQILDGLLADGREEGHGERMFNSSVLSGDISRRLESLYECVAGRVMPAVVPH